MNCRNYLGRVKSKNPIDIIETVIGHYNFHVDDEGNTIVTDYYDFTPGKSLLDTVLAPFLGSKADGDKNISWSINLGKIE